MNLALTQTYDCSFKSKTILHQMQLCFISEHLQGKKKLYFFLNWAGTQGFLNINLEVIMWDIVYDYSTGRTKLWVAYKNLELHAVMCKY